MLAKYGLVAATLAAVVFSSAGAHAGIAANDLCKDKKYKASGKNVSDLLKAFGKNKKTPNVTKLAFDISKAQSKLSKGFTKAEFTGSGASLGCDTIEDVTNLEGMGQRHVQAVLTALDGVSCTTACCYSESVGFPPETACVEYTGSAAQIGVFAGTCVGPSLPTGPGAWFHTFVPGPCVAGPTFFFPCVAPPNWTLASPDSNCP
jgi:hypothetical protein